VLSAIASHQPLNLTRMPVGAGEPYRLAALRCNGASNKAKAAETAALQIGPRRPRLCLIVHGLRNPKGYHPAFRTSRDAQKHKARRNFPGNQSAAPPRNSVVVPAYNPSDHPQIYRVLRQYRDDHARVSLNNNDHFRVGNEPAVSDNLHAISRILPRTASSDLVHPHR